MNKDYYQILGVLPSAEAIVITAAYRALASQYHPDRWKGDPAVANQKMAEINVAYEVLGNAGKRKAYDESRDSSRNTYEDESSQTDAAFEEAMSQQESRWQKACDIFPDLIHIRKRLSKTSHRLAFAFVMIMLETKNFDARKTIANELEQSFLELHFGTNPDIVNFAKHLISLGHKKAIVALNDYVDVLGSHTTAKPIIEKIRNEFDVSMWEQELSARAASEKSKAAAAERDRWARARMAAGEEYKRKEAERERVRARQALEAAELQRQLNVEKIEDLKSKIRIHRRFSDASELLALQGYETITVSQGLFRPKITEIYKKTSDGAKTLVVKFESHGKLVIWAVENLCR